MAEAAEGGNPIPYEMKIRSQFDKKLREADTEEKKSSLIQQLLQSIKNADGPSQKATEEAVKKNSSTIPPIAKEEKEKAAEPVLELFQLLNAQKIGAVDEEFLKKLNFSPTQKSFFESLSATAQNADSATFLVPIINKIIADERYIVLSVGGESPTSFENDVAAAKRNPLVKNALVEGIRRLVRDKKIIDTAGNILNEKSALQSLQLLDERDREVNNTEYRKKYEEYSVRLSQAIQDETKNINASLQKIQIKRNQIESSSLPEEEKERQLEQLRQEEIKLNDNRIEIRTRPSAIMDYLNHSEIQPPFKSEEEIRNYLVAQSFGEDEIDEMKKIFPLMADIELRGRALGQGIGYEVLGQKITNDYSRLALQAKIIKDGQIDMDALKEVQANIEDDIGVLFDTLYTSPKSDFQEAFNPYTEGQMLSNVIQYLRTEFSELAKNFAKQKISADTSIDSKEFRDFKSIADRIFRDEVISSIQRRRAIEQVLHQYQQMGATIELENLKNIYKKYDITTLQEFYNDELTRIMSDLMPQFIQKKFLENGNQVIPDFFQLRQDEETIESGVVRSNGKEGEYKHERQVVKYKDECIEYMLDVLTQMEDSGLINTKVSKDRINARFSRAYLDNFLLTLRGIKVMSNSIPQHAQFEDVPYWHIMTRVFNPMHDWPNLGKRGRGSKRSGASQVPEYVGMWDYMINEDKHEEWRQKFGDIFDNFHPDAIVKRGEKMALFQEYPDNATLMEDLKNGRWDVFQTLRDVYRGAASGNIIDMGGWPFQGFMDESIVQAVNNLKDEKGNAIDWDKIQKNRDAKFDAIYRTAGVIPAFWFAGEETGNDTTRQFKKYVAREYIQQKRETGDMRPVNAIADEYFLRYSQQEYEKELDKYTVDKDRFKKIYDVRLGDKQTKVSHREYKLHRENAIKGQIFHQLLLKDPLAWLGEMSQSYPELLQGYVEYTAMDSVKHHVLASDFYFNLADYPDKAISKNDKVKRDRFRFEILTKFKGKEEDVLSNVPHIKKIMDFYANLYRSYAAQPIENKREINDLEWDALVNGKKAARDSMYEQLSKAHQLAVKGQKSRIDPQHTIKIKNGQQDTRVHDLLFSQDGLITHFEDMVHSRKNYFGDGEQDLGEEEGFYQRWAYSYKQMSRNSLPEGDTNMDLLFKDAKSMQMLDRKLQTNITFAKAQEVLGKVPGVCKEASTADSFDQWYGQIEKLHEEMKEVEGEDEGVEQQYQMQLYVTICNYFSLDSDVERFLIGMIYDAKLGNKKSIATLKSDYGNKFLLDADARRMYLLKLRESTYIKGAFDSMVGAGMDTVERMAGVSAFEIYSKQMMYAVMAGAVFVVAAAIKEGYEEEVDKD